MAQRRMHRRDMRVVFRVPFQGFLYPYKRCLWQELMNGKEREGKGVWDEDRDGDGDGGAGAGDKSIYIYIYIYIL